MFITKLEKNIKTKKNGREEMKIRTGFVSNSSSSSFIVIGKEPTGCMYVKLNPKQVEAIINHIKTREYDKRDVKCSPTDGVFLTQFLSDCDDAWLDIQREYHSYEYCPGGHDGPYDDEYFDNLGESENYWNSVWILKDHNLEV
jgi:hypothetical protein